MTRPNEHEPSLEAHRGKQMELAATAFAVLSPQHRSNTDRRWNHNGLHEVSQKDNEVSLKKEATKTA